MYPSIKEIENSDRYRRLLDYMGSLGYSRSEAKEEILNYALSGKYCDLGDFVKYFIPLRKKLKKPLKRFR